MFQGFLSTPGHTVSGLGPLSVHRVQLLVPGFHPGLSPGRGSGCGAVQVPHLAERPCRGSAQQQSSGHSERQLCQEGVCPHSLNQQGQDCRGRMVSIKKAILFLLKAFILFQTKKSAELLIRPSSKQEITLLKSPLASITDRGNNNNKEETASLLNLFDEETEVVKNKISQETYTKKYFSLNRKTALPHLHSNLVLYHLALLCHLPHL